MADEQIQGVPPGLTAEPIQGVPPGLTAEPVQASAQEDQIQGVPPGLTAEPIVPEKPGMLKNIWDKLNTGLVSKDTFVRALTGMTSEQLDQQLAPYADETPTHAAFREFTRGTLQDIGGTASTFTSPLAVGTMAAGAAGKIPGAVGTIAKAVTGVASAGFGVQGLKDMLSSGMSLEDAKHAMHLEGDPEKWQQLLQGAGMAILGGTGAVESRGAFRTTKQAYDAASKVHESAKTVFDQRMHEADIARQQAHFSTEEAKMARNRELEGQGTAQQTIDAQEKASQAAANARKAQEALKQAGATRAEAGVEVDRLGRKVQKSQAGVSEKQTKASAGAREDFKKAVPSAPKGKAAYTDRDLDITDGYLERHHQNVEQIDSVKGMVEALDHVDDDLESQMAPYRERYANEPITRNVRMDVREELAENPRADFVEKGMRALENYNLTDPTVEEADAIRKQLNGEVRKGLADSKWDIGTALLVDPDFAAKYHALDSLRNGEYDVFEDKGVEGIRELQRDRASIIKVKNAAFRQFEKGNVKVRGSNQPGAMRKAAAWTLNKAGIGVGAKVGGPAGAVFGDIATNRASALGKMIYPDDLTRDQLIQRRMKVSGVGSPITEIQGAGAPATPFELPGQVPQRENTPLHSELATHYGEHVANSSYHELEQRFMEDLADKQRHGVPLESPEKNLLGKINQQNAADALAAQQAAQEAAATGKSLIPEPTLPEAVTPLLHAPEAKFGPGMDTHKGIVHNLANAVVGDERGITFSDGVRSHLHTQNIKSGAVMSAPMDLTDFMDEDGNVDNNKVKSRIADIAATYVAGGVANDLYHDIPFTENQGLGADTSALKKFMKSAGFSNVEADKLISQAADDAAQVLSRPGVQDILEQHAAVRESGLNEGYHVSPERMEQILKDVKGQNESTTGNSERNPSGTSGAGERASKGAGAGTEVKPKEGNPAELRQETKGPVEGKGAGVRADEPAKPAEASEPRAGKLESEDLITSERQSPLKRDYKVEVIDQAGESQTETIPGFSGKDALKTAQKKFPGKASYVVDHPEAEPVNPTMKYEVPTGKTLSMPESGHSETHTMRHELGHAMVGLKEDMNPRGVYRHTHTEMSGGNARAAVGWSMEGLIEPTTGRIKADKLPGVLRNLMGGIAADEAFNDMPRAANRNFDTRFGVGDGGQGYRILREAGYEHDDAMQMMHEAIDQTKEYLTNPHVSDIIKENEGVREPGLSRQYHYSPDRLRQMHLEAQRRINATEQPGIDNRAVSGEGAEGRAADVAGREGGGPQAPGPATAPQDITATERLPKRRAGAGGVSSTLPEESPFAEHAISEDHAKNTNDSDMGHGGKAWLNTDGTFVPQDKVHEDLTGNLYRGNIRIGNLEGNGPVLFHAEGRPTEAQRAAIGKDISKQGVIYDLTHQGQRVSGETENPGEFWRAVDQHYGGSESSKVSPGSTTASQEMYHITPAKNVPEIMKNGLTPQVGERGAKVGEAKGIHLFKNTADADNALSNWLGDEFEDEPLSMLKVNVPKNAQSLPGAAEYEHIHGTTIKPEDITVHRKDADFPELSPVHSAIAKAAGTKGEGFTFNPKTGETPTTGHMVETIPEAGKSFDHPPTAEDIHRYVADNKETIDKHPELHVGGYGNTLGVSGRYGDEATADAAARKLDQISRYDLEKGKEIETGGTGKTTSFPEYPIDERIDDLSKSHGLNTAELKSPKGSSVPLMENPLKIKGTGEGERVNTLDVAKALNKYTTKKLPALEMGKAEPAEQVERAKSIAEDEAKYQLHQNNSGKAWYTTDMGVHDDVLQRMRPELKDPVKLSLFKMAEAVLSSGQKPYANMKAGIKAWDHYNETGEFPATNPNTGKSWGPRGAAAYGNAIESINKLIQEKGEKGASEWLLSEHPVSELRQYNKLGVSGKQSDSKLGAMILGEKRGPFAQNLHGIESAFTADMWVSRTWNRWMGTLDTKPTPDGDTASDAPKNNTERKLMSQSFEETAKKLNLTTSSLQAILWYYEQGLYDVHGAKKESWSFADAAKRIEKEQGEADKQQDQGNMFGDSAPPPKPTAPAGQVHALDFMKLLGGKK